MYVRLRDVRLFFDTLGAQLACDGPAMRERPTLLVLHGGPGLDHSTVRPWFDALAAFARSSTSTSEATGAATAAARSSGTSRRADDVHGFCTALGIERPVVIGTSFGGYVAMYYAIRYPDHPAKLVLVSTARRGTANRARRERIIEAFQRLGGTLARNAARRALDERTPAAYEEYVRVCGPLYTVSPPDPDASRRPIANRDVIQWFERPGGEGAVFELSTELQAIACPTLILGGEDDPITPPDEQQEIADALRPGIGRFFCFAGCGHGVWRDDPKRPTAALAEFLSTASGELIAGRAEPAVLLRSGSAKPG